MTTTPKILPPQNSPVFEQRAGGMWAMAKPWVLFFQELYKLAKIIVTRVSAGVLGNFAAINTDGTYYDSGFSAIDFLLVSSLPVYSVNDSWVTTVSGGTPNIQIQTRNFQINDGIVTSVSAETTLADVKPKAYKDIAMDLTGRGAATAPSLVAWNGGTIYVYAFSGTSVTAESLYGVTEYNHEFREGAPIIPHIHWAPGDNTAGNVKWNLTYVWDNIGAGPSAETTISLTSAASGTAFRLIKSNFPQITASGKQIGSQIQFRLWRNAADAADTYAGNAFIQTFGIHAEVDSFGSTTPTSK